MQNKNLGNNSSKRPSPKPIQDVIVQKQASKFPDVGMTLSTYQRVTPTPAKLLKMPNPSPTHPRRLKRIFKVFSFKRIAIVLLLLALISGGWVGGKFLYNAHKVFGGNIFSIIKTTKLQGESTGRVNILLAGNSADDAGHDGANLTDSIMIVSIDTVNHKVFLLSVPRDLWVDVPGYGHQKINAAYVDGQNDNFNQSGYFTGGMGQLQQVIEQNFGITINYYALINYTAFKDAVDAVGGIDVVINSSDKRGLYDPSIDWTTKGPLVKLTNGPHHLTGEQALDLARARGDDYRSYGFPNSDFDRTQNQRMMLVALKAKVVTAGVLANPAKLSSLSDAIGNNVTTNFSLSEVRRAYDLIKSIDSTSIQSLSLNDANGNNLLANYTSSDGQEALIPAAGLDNFSVFQAFMTQHMSSNPVVQEGATVVALNATATAGVASKAKTALAAQNISVAYIGDAKTAQATTTIIDASNGKMPATKALLQKIYGNNVTTVNPYSSTYVTDFIVLLGSDQLTAATSPTAAQ
jgi:LCP family protein required for cell wall assembly